jgi:hypothetical protein
MADIIQFPRAPEPTEGDGEGPTEIVVRIVLEIPEKPPDASEEEQEEAPPQKSKGGWGWFWLGALLGVGLGG